MNKYLEESLIVIIFATSRLLIDDLSVLQNRWSTMKFWPIPNTMTDQPSEGLSKRALLSATHQWLYQIDKKQMF